MKSKRRENLMYPVVGYDPNHVSKWQHHIVKSGHKTASFGTSSMVIFFVSHGSLNRSLALSDPSEMSKIFKQQKSLFAAVGVGL